MLVLPGTDARHAHANAEHLRREVEARCTIIEEIPVGMTVSIGSAQYTSPETTEALVRRADAAMYAAKKAGRNQVVAADVAVAGGPA